MLKYDNVKFRHEFAHLFSGKLIKTAATRLTRAVTLTPVCTKSFVGWGFAPDPTGGAYSAPPYLVARSKGPYF